MTKKRIIIIIISIILIILIVIGYHYYRILTAKILVETKPVRNIEVFDEVHISDMLISINGKLINDDLIDTSKVGKQDIEFSYINDDNIKVSFTFDVTIEDNTEPLIGGSNNITVGVGTKENIVDKFFCGDNYDDEPNCFIEGDYDLTTTGTYDLIFKAIDSSKNEESLNFKLNVIEPKENKTYNDPNKEIETTDYNEIVKNYKNKDNKIGIDVSRWQGKIDFKKVKASNVEFAMIRVGSEDKDGNLFVDPKFEEYIKGFNEVKIPVGVYYYSYADSVEDAKKEAKFVLKQIKKYDIDLPVVFDWENWSNYREYNLSFHSLTNVAEAFLSTIEKEGYKGMLYSSKYYLENIWFKTDYDVWLAHYTKQTNYEGKYVMWQLCSNGKVDGINDNMVDIDILYK